MTARTAPRRRPDGSLDTSHYMEIGRRHRAAQARRMFAALRPGTRAEGSR